MLEIETEFHRVVCVLAGGDAYHCEKCNKKVNTVKRLCVKKLPPILAIQLKRFEYDYERLCPIKFNDYFEFPRVLDMEPYTVWGLAKAEGEVRDLDFSLDFPLDIPLYFYRRPRLKMKGILMFPEQPFFLVET